MDCIMLAAGKGERAKLGYPKQFARLDGKPIFIHTLETFEAMPEISRIIMAIIPDIEAEYQKALDDYSIKKVIMVPGGKTRQGSVRNCLERVESNTVLIHEAVRPFVTQEFIMSVITSCERSGAVVPIVEIKETILQRSNFETAIYPDRKAINLVQMPQRFYRYLLESAYRWAPHNDFTDDSSLIAAYPGTIPIYLIPGLEQNIKITTPLDLLYAEVLHREGYCGCNRRQ